MSPRLKGASGIGPVGPAIAPAAASDGGAGRIRTGDPLLAKQVLCQLSYDPGIGCSD